MNKISILYSMLLFSRAFSYFTNHLLKLCEPCNLRTYLKEEMSKHYTYLTYPRAKNILHKHLTKIDIYGDNTECKNVEHIFPQYAFKLDERKNIMRTDLHNLYLCNHKLNNYRQNYKYVDSNTAQDMDNIKILDMKGNIVSRDEDLFSKKGYLMITNKKSKVFIPSNYSRGKIARALAYFSVKYDYLDQLNDIIDIRTMLEWNLKDPVDNDEYLKNVIIYKHQGNLNPFIVDPDLLVYAFSDKLTIDNELMNKKRHSYIDPFYTIEFLLNEINALEKSHVDTQRILNKMMKHNK